MPDLQTRDGSRRCRPCPVQSASCRGSGRMSVCRSRRSSSSPSRRSEMRAAGRMCSAACAAAQCPCRRLAGNGMMRFEWRGTHAQSHFTQRSNAPEKQRETNGAHSVGWSVKAPEISGFALQQCRTSQSDAGGPDRCRCHKRGRIVRETYRGRLSGARAGQRRERSTTRRRGRASDLRPR